jgi:LuxR family transcriptional activator of conjugal transfer of Ti plasmids
MKPPSEALLQSAIDQFADVTCAEEVAQAAAAFTGACGLERYAILVVRTGVVAGVFHDAPDHLRADFPRVISGDDPVVTMARASRVPFLWSSDTGGEWRRRNGDAGYLSGVAAATWDSRGTGCILLASGAEAAIHEAHAQHLLIHAFMATSTANDPLQRVAAQMLAPCPLTERELECLYYAVAGKSAKETARALGVGPRTVDEYLERARAKLQVKTSLAAATVAIRNGWLDVQKALDLAA